MLFDESNRGWVPIVCTVSLNDTIFENKTCFERVWESFIVVDGYTYLQNLQGYKSPKMWPIWNSRKIMIERGHKRLWNGGFNEGLKNYLPKSNFLRVTSRFYSV